MECPASWHIVNDNTISQPVAAFDADQTGFDLRYGCPLADLGCEPRRNVFRDMPAVWALHANDLPVGQIDEPGFVL